MPSIRRTIKTPAQEDKVEVFHVPLNNRLSGWGVNNKVVYDLKKRGRAEVKFADGVELIFEVCK